MTNDTERRICYKSGVTRTPSDFLCGDGELAECINLTTDTEEIKTVGDPKKLANGLAENHQLVFVHKLPDGTENYITKTSGGSLYWSRPGVNTTSLDITVGAGFTANQIEAVGKTIVVCTTDGIKYAVWQGAEYKKFGEIPEPRVAFVMVRNESVSGSGNFQNSKNRVSKTMTGSFFDENSQGIFIATDHEEEYNNAVASAYVQNKKEICQKKGFCEPFFVRMAVELYDGSYTKISQPILMLPTMTENSHGRAISVGEDVDSFTLETQFCELYYRYLDANVFQGLEDIVKGVTVFATDGISIYDTNVKQQIVLNGNTENDWTFDGVFVTRLTDSFDVSNCFASRIKRNYDHYFLLTRRPYAEIKRDIESSSVFYKLGSIDVFTETTGTNYAMANRFDVHTLENITTQEQLKNDDYFSHAKLTASTLFAYNSRINMAGISRTAFKGFDFFFPQMQNYGSYNNTVINVRVKTLAGTVLVKRIVGTVYSDPTWWFYYPDPRAEWVTVYNNVGQLLLDTQLKEHPGLNGAYYFRGMPAKDHSGRNLYPDAPVPAGSSAGSDTIPDDAAFGGTETLVNQIATSEVNNPWVFNASGYNTIGNGKVLAMSTLTQALSQGQFGQYPLLVFCDDGIWAMSLDNTGLFIAVHPMSREVIIEGTQPLQTDGAVFFASKKGLMVIVGSDVRCVSEQMNGRTFDVSTVDCLTEESLNESENGRTWSGLLGSCADSDLFQAFFDSHFSMAYDYMDSRILLINSGYGYCWSYSIKDGSFSKVILPKKMVTVVNDYPDYLMQSEDGSLYSLYEKEREEGVTTRKYGFLLTRPMKTGGPCTVVSLRELVNVGYWDEVSESCVKTIVLVSDNLKDWYQLTSRFGAAARYFRIALFVKLLPSERLSGTILRVQKRRDNNLR